MSVVFAMDACMYAYMQSCFRVLPVLHHVCSHNYAYCTHAQNTRLSVQLCGTSPFCQTSMFNISHSSVLLYYTSWGLSRIISLPEGYKGNYHSEFPPSGYHSDQPEPLFTSQSHHTVILSTVVCAPILRYVTHRTTLCVQP